MATTHADLIAIKVTNIATKETYTEVFSSELKASALVFYVHVYFTGLVTTEVTTQYKESSNNANHNTNNRPPNEPPELRNRRSKRY